MRQSVDRLCHHRHVHITFSTLLILNRRRLRRLDAADFRSLHERGGPCKIGAALTASSPSCWQHNCQAAPRRITPSIRSNLICGRDKASSAIAGRRSMKGAPSELAFSASLRRFPPALGMSFQPSIYHGARACRSASSRHPKQNLADDSTPAG